ncbi:MAG: 30S ribosomal protein S9 [Patescibacteria group bacterium]|jgi:small subunit ribosomal protein S9
MVQATISKKSYLSAIGRRKCAVANVRFYKKDTGDIEVNGQPFKKYFPTKELQAIVKSPLVRVGVGETSKITIKVNGGGKQAQAESTRLAIARVLVLTEATLKPALRQAGYLTRDPRVKERKKPGLKRARRAPQWAKR